MDRDELAGQAAVTMGDLLSGEPHTRVIDASIRKTKVRLYAGREFSDVDVQDLLTAIDGDRPTRKGIIQPRTAPNAARRTTKGGTE